MSLGNSSSIFSNFGFNFCTIFCIGNFDFAGCSDKSKVFWFGGFPFSAIGTSAALANQERLYCIIICIERATNFEGFQIFFLKSSFVIHIPPGAAFIIYIDEIALHLWKRCVIADDFLRLNAPQHLVVASQKPVFLVAAVVVF